MLSSKEAIDIATGETGFKISMKCIENQIIEAANLGCFEIELESLLPRQKETLENAGYVVVDTIGGTMVKWQLPSWASTPLKVRNKLIKYFN